MFWYKPILYCRENRFINISTDIYISGIQVELTGTITNDDKIELCWHGASPIKSLGTIKYNEWNFIAIKTHKNDIYDFTLYLNGLDCYGQNSSKFWLKDKVNIKFGREDGEYRGKIAGLVFTMSELDNSVITKYYEDFKKYVFEYDYLDTNEKTFTASCTNLYNDTIYQDFEVIPLNNSLNSLNGVTPKIFSKREFEGPDRDLTFDYNNNLKRYLYCANGKELIYDFNLENTGTLISKVIFGYSSLGQCIFENVDECNKSLALFRGISTSKQNYVLYLDIDGLLIETGLQVKIKELYTIMLSWTLIENYYEDGQLFHFHIRCNDQMFTTEKKLSFKYGHLLTSIGRFKQGDKLNSWPIMGHMEMLGYRKYYTGSLLFNDLNELLKVNSNSKQYDELGLIKKKTISNDTNNLLINLYNYQIVTENRIAPLIDTEVISTKSDSSIRQYSYDKNNNVTKIKLNDNVIREYTYKCDNKLETEVITSTNERHSYIYNQNGNISSIVIKDKDSIDEGTMTSMSINTLPIIEPKIINFTYDEPKWSDRLTKVEINGQVKELKYDILYPGNPTFYGIGTQGIEYTWEGRRLVRFKNNITNLIIDNTYNDQGLRTKKSVNNVVTSYYYEGSKLVSECTNNKSKFFLYDENNLLYGLIYNNEKYFYIRDILGNILGLIDNNGYTVVKYEYTIFGNILSISGTLKDTLGKDNPFIYKGYYYDFETSLYYCNSRYYNPEWGRWLNADSVNYLDPRSINGLNLFSYCINNPIMYFDNMGTAPVRVSLLYGNTFSTTTTNLLGRPLNIFGETSGGGLIYSKNRNLSNCPNWLEIGAFYGEVTPLVGLSLLKAEIGIAKIGFKSNKFFSGDQNAIWNPNLFAEIGALTADGNIGVGISGKASVLSLSIGAELGNSLKISGTVYVGAGLSVDLSNGIKLGVGLGLGFEISAEFNWINTIKWIWE